MKQDAKEAFKKTALGAQNAAYDIIAKLDPEYFEKLKGLYVDGTFGREGALPRKTKELIMIGITCALNRPRGVRLPHRPGVRRMGPGRVAAARRRDPV